MNKKKTTIRKSKRALKKHQSIEEQLGVPKWMGCTWRRIPCGKDSCEICGMIKKDREKHIVRGEDPDDPSVIFEDVMEDFGEIVSAIRARGGRVGIDRIGCNLIADPPRPATFSLYREVKDWRDSLFAIIENAEESDDEFWIYTEAVEDVAWYANLLPAKVYRQLCNRWYMAKGYEFGRFDYAYTKYVIGECVRILRDAFAELASFDMAQKGEFLMVSAELLRLEDKLLDI